MLVNRQTLSFYIFNVRAILLLTIFPHQCWRPISYFLHFPHCTLKLFSFSIFKLSILALLAQFLFYPSELEYDPVIFPMTMFFYLPLLALFIFATKNCKFYNDLQILEKHQKQQHIKISISNEILSKKEEELGRAFQFINWTPSVS